MSDWALGKKLNSQMTDIPLNCMIIANNLQTFGDSSFFYDDKQFVEALAKNKICVNMKSIAERICIESMKKGFGESFLSLLDTDIANIVLGNNDCIDAIVSANLIGNVFAIIDDVGWGFDYQSVKSISDFESADWLADFCANVITSKAEHIDAITRILRSGIDSIKKNKNAVVLYGEVTDFDNFDTNRYSGSGIFIKSTYEVRNFREYTITTYIDESASNIEKIKAFNKSIYGSFVWAQGGTNMFASIEIVCLKK